MALKKTSNLLKLSDYQALAEFRYQIRRFLRFSEDAARAAGLEPQQHQLLLTVKGMPGGEASRIADIAERLQIRHHSAVELIDRLAARGLVTRAVGDDRREIYVHLSARGEAILGILTLPHQRELQRMAPALVASLEKVAGRQRADNSLRSQRPGARRLTRNNPDAPRAERARV
jgi:DNA-binding MarR family transcriptional regulator